MAQRVGPSRLREFRPDEPLEPLADPVEQWLQWEEQANLVGFRVTTRSVEIDVCAVPRAAVEVWSPRSAPQVILRRFLRGSRVLFPKHPLNRDASVGFFEERARERWLARYTSSRTLVVPQPRGEPLFSLKLSTDYPHPDFHQPEKTKLRAEALDAISWVELLDRVEGLLGPTPDLLVVREALAVLVPERDTGYVVRDLRFLEDGNRYLPALSIPWVGRQIARRQRGDFGSFWGEHYAGPIGRAKALLLARTGLQFETPNPQNVLVQLDAALRPTGRIVLRDLGDTNCATDAPTCTTLPWSRLLADLRPETHNSFWAFAEAGAHSVEAATLEDWYVRHDRAYFEELARWFPRLAPAGSASGERTLDHWNTALRDPAAAAAIAASFAARAASARRGA